MGEAAETGRDDPEVRGPDQVRAALVAAARRLLADRAAADITGRELAAEAGVNYGLIHHYFGSKDNVFSAALVAEIQDNYDGRLSQGRPMPIYVDEHPAFAIFGHLVVNGGLDEGHPFPLLSRTIPERCRALGRPEDDPEIAAEVLAFGALQLGWGVFRSVFLDVVRHLGLDEEAVLRHVEARSARVFDDHDPAAEPAPDRPD